MQCKKIATRTRDLSVTCGKTLPWTPTRPTLLDLEKKNCCALFSMSPVTLAEKKDWIARLLLETASLIPNHGLIGDKSRVVWMATFTCWCWCPARIVAVSCSLGTARNAAGWLLEHYLTTVSQIKHILLHWGKKGVAQKVQAPITGPCLDTLKISSFFTFSVISIFSRLHGALNIGKKITNCTV